MTDPGFWRFLRFFGLVPHFDLSAAVEPVCMPQTCALHPSLPLKPAAAHQELNSTQWCWWWWLMQPCPVVCGPLSPTLAFTHTPAKPTPLQANQPVLGHHSTAALDACHQQPSLRQGLPHRQARAFCLLRQKETISITTLVCQLPLDAAAAVDTHICGVS